MKLFYFLLSIILLSNQAYAQEDCNCETNFLWMKKTFEENDAGFAYIISKKGQDAYQMHNNAYLEKVKTIKEERECAIAMDQWLRFFRQGHVGVNYKVKQATTSSTPEKLEITKFNTKEFEHYLKSKKDPGYEGIWFAEPYKIGIRRMGESYVGFIMETTAENWKIGELKTKFDNHGGIYYLKNKTGEKFGSTQLKLEGNNDLQLGNFMFKRIYPVMQNDPEIELDMKLLTSPKPFLERLNASTVILRIPSFEISEKKYIDSVILTNKATILSTPSLIIDVRNNGGGSDASFKEILPLLYTNPIRTVGVEFLSTKLNNQRMLDLSNNADFEEASRKQFKVYYDTLEKSLGKFVSLSAKRVGIDKKDTVYAYPRQVGILINEKNGSTTEQFLLAAKQSKKVKLFGVTTFGMLDISNVHIIDFPCSKFELYYGLSKSYRIPGLAIDDIGLQPDYFIDGTVRKEWINFTDKILNTIH